MLTILEDNAQVGFFLELIVFVNVQCDPGDRNGGVAVQQKNTEQVIVIREELYLNALPFLQIDVFGQILDWQGSIYIAQVESCVDLH